MTDVNKMRWVNVALGIVGLVLTVVIAWAGSLTASVKDEVKVRRNEDIRIEDKMDIQQRRIEDKLDDIQTYIMESN
jgi:hypothetical protein